MAGQKNKVTIFDVAKASGVSSSAVSYALNDKPGVSEATRAKVLKVAQQLGWKPNGAAQSLARSNTSRIGVVLAREAHLLSVEPYMMELLAGLGAELEQHDYSLLLRFAVGRDTEMAILNDWIATGSVDALLLVNLEMNDRRVALLKKHPEMPVLAMCDPSLSGGLPAMRSLDMQAVGKAVSYLHDLGHQRIGRVGGPESFGHSYIRDAAFCDAATELGVRYRCLHADYTPKGGIEATKLLLSVEPRPTAIIYDNDVMALAGMGIAREMGFDVPQDLSIMAWDDSFMCTAVFPHLTVMGRDIVGSGRKAARLLLDLIDGKQVTVVEESPYDLRERASTGPAPILAGE
ncbi:LacI family DNA-binding transcriptional regulator [Bifidobacterium panos]|uniref:LacI family transcriptional regulator n=1 Tax=Bifidobacterium panos TaxID=2675321 RepID=A0ABX1SYP3_9BIFI|nr:LacI family transcriptional regulator [Bifidobacterium sp. DSM 109963]